MQDEETKRPLIDDGKQSTCSSITRKRLRNFAVVGSLCAATLLANITFSIIAPFYPQRARAIKDDGPADTEVGLVYGTFAFAAFLSAPILGNHVTLISPKFMLQAGVFLVGGSSVLFGALAYVNEWAPFLGLSLACAAVQGLGSAAVVTASWTIVLTEFPDRVSTFVGLLELMEGLGYTIGPSVGGGLYAVKGFALPLYFVGSLLLLSLIGIVLILPKIEVSRDASNISMLKLLRNFWIWMDLGSLMLNIGVYALFEVVAGTFLWDAFDMPPNQIGLIFLGSSGSYMLTSLLSGYLADKYGEKKFIIYGLIVGGVSFLFVAPSSLFTFIPSQKLWVFCLALMIHCMAIGFSFAPIVGDMVNCAVAMGYEEGIELNGVLSGLAASFVSLGCVIGPLLGGSLTARMNFRWSSTIFGLWQASHGYIYLVTALCFRKI